MYTININDVFCKLVCESPVYLTLIDSLEINFITVHVRDLQFYIDHNIMMWMTDEE